MADIRIDSIAKRFRDIQAVAELSLDVRDGEFVVLLGPTGAGKTTTLRLVAGLESADAGRIAIDGRDVTTAPPAMRDVAFVFQQYSLYPHLSVFDNLAFPLRAPARRTPAAEIDRRVRNIAARLRIDQKLDSRVTQLSGGQMQRVAIGRALVRSPALYLMDEPLSSLDAKLRIELRLELKRLQRELGATMLYVTHDQTEAMTMADRIGVMEAGRLVQCGTPREIYENPVNVHVAARLGQPTINLLPAALFPDARLPPQVATIGARTEHLALARGDDARVIRVEHLGDQDHLHLDLRGHTLVALADPGADLVPGDRVSVALASPLLFATDGARVHA